MALISFGDIVRLDEDRRANSNNLTRSFCFLLLQRTTPDVSV